MIDSNGAPHAVPALRNEAPRMERTAPPLGPEPELGTTNPLQRTSANGIWTWATEETAWTVDVFVRMFATIVVLRTISQLVGHWWFPRSVWDASRSLVRGFGGTSAAQDSAASKDVDHDSDEEDDGPELVLTADGERFYNHDVRQPSQYWPCPLLLRDRCRDCRWFTEDVTGAPRCAAVAKVLTRHHTHYRHFTLDELRELLERGRPGAFA